MMIKIKPYRKRHDQILIDLIKYEGDEWKDYSDEDKKDLYILNCEKSITYLLFDDQTLIGYIRALEDYGYYIYICDLLIDQRHRGHGYGKLLIEHLKEKYPKHELYVMSDEDDYYHKQGFKKVGSIFKI